MSIPSTTTSRSFVHTTRFGSLGQRNAGMRALMRALTRAALPGQPPVCSAHRGGSRLSLC